MSRYLDLCHAMQSGVAMKMNYSPADTDPKHLRVGINAAMCDNAGLVKLLIDKGVITEQEYMAAIEEAMSLEVKRYEDWLNEHMGDGASKITLR